MPAKNEPDTEAETLAKLARLIYDEMNIEPRRMNVAITLAKQHLADLRATLIDHNLRRP